jgi:hypothetical protein
MTFALARKDGLEKASGIVMTDVHECLANDFAEPMWLFFQITT